MGSKTTKEAKNEQLKEIGEKANKTQNDDIDNNTISKKKKIKKKKNLF